MSPIPSFVKSAIATPEGFAPDEVVNGELGATENVASPLFRNTLMVLSVEFTTARSGTPSEFKSPAAIAIGPLPVAKGDPVATVKVPSNVVPGDSRIATLFVSSFTTAKSGPLVLTF